MGFFLNLGTLKIYIFNLIKHNSSIISYLYYRTNDVCS